METKGKGHFVATPLEFTLDGETYTYSGRGRWTSQLAQLVAREGKVPEKQEDGTWGWRDADEQETASATKLVEKLAARLKAKADKDAARLAARAAKTKKTVAEPATV